MSGQFNIRRSGSKKNSPQKQLEGATSPFGDTTNREMEGDGQVEIKQLDLTRLGMQHMMKQETLEGQYEMDIGGNEELSSMQRTIKYF